jgi:hypothetical protein
MFGPGQLGPKEAHRETESCCAYFTEFPMTEIKGLA